MKAQLLIVTALFACMVSFAQAPQGFNYQAVARDMAGEELIDHSLSVRIGILQDEMLLWQEEHNVTTNSIGLFNLVIGNPDVVGSGTAGTFADIPWGSGILELKVDINDGSGYTDFAPSPLQSVPFALHAANGPQGEQGPTGDTGPKGDQGETGPQGLQGVQGPQGPIGQQGPQGAIGPAGPQGEQGEQGPQGEKGDAGTGLANQGDWVSGTSYNPGDYVFDRSTGDPGINSMWIMEDEAAYTSSINPYNDPDHWVEFQAPEGPQGPQGETGPQGAQGLMGPEGPTGPQGETGLQGPQGEQGIQGDTGPQGPAGPQGDQGIQGEVGPEGPQGDTGPQGIQGDQGLQGPQGVPGVQGIQGDPGPQGPQGEIGPQGPPGPDEQTLTITGSDLIISGGNSVNLSSAIATESGWDMITTPDTTILAGNPVEINASVDPLFEVKNAQGIPVFAVYNDSVRVYIDEDAKGIKGGFAVGGYSKTSKGATQNYLHIMPDSARIYVNDDAMTKGVKGGFAVGGYSKTSKGLTDNYMEINRGSTHVFFDEDFPPTGKGVKGGFAVGGYRKTSKGLESDQLFSLTPDNFLGGQEAGINLPNGYGYDNSFLGYRAGYTATDAWDNVFIGKEAGFLTTNGYQNVFLGNRAGYSTTTGIKNVFIGYIAGELNEGGSNNVFLGSEAGNGNTTGSTNVFVGSKAGLANWTGSQNVFIGEDAGLANKHGVSNVFVGYRSGWSNYLDGSYNVFVGHEAGYGNTSGNYSVMIGHEAGYANTTGGYSVIIGYNAGKTTSTNDYVTAMGYCAGETSTGANNVFVGGECGKQHGTGDYNAFYGMSAGVASNGGYNTYLGAWSGWHNDGDLNTAVGYSAGYGANTFAYNRGAYLGSYSGASQTSGSQNTFLGYGSGRNSTTGGYNVMIGYEAGYNNSLGTGNVFIGYQTGYHETTSNKLYIHNSSVTNPLIYGDFSVRSLRFNGNVAINSTPTENKLYIYDGSQNNDLPAIAAYHAINPYYGIGIDGTGGYVGVRGFAYISGTGTRIGLYGNASGGESANYGVFGVASGTSAYAVYASGDLAYTGSLLNASDGKFKENIETVGSVLSSLMNLKPRKYNYAETSETKSMNMPEGKHYGLIAQEIETVFPDLVVESVHPMDDNDKKGQEITYKGVKYMEMIPILLKAIQEQQAQIEALEDRVRELE